MTLKHADGNPAINLPTALVPSVASTLGSRGTRSHTEIDGHGALVPETTRSQTARYDSSEDGTGRGVPLLSAYSISPGSVEKGKKDDLHVVVTNVSRTLNATPDPTLHQGGDIIVANAREDPITSGNCSLPLGAKDTGHAIAFTDRTRKDGRNIEIQEELAYSLNNPGTGGRSQERCLLHEMQVRRLTPTECERLQGFPDNWTRIPWRGKAPEDCPDGPRYKSIGNSMAVPCMLYIGQRIQQYANSQEAL